MTVPAYLAQASDAEIDRLLWSAYFSRHCPGCGGRKASEQPLCVSCHARLSDEQRAALTIPIDPGYELALFRALESAGVAVPIDGVRRSARHFQNSTAKVTTKKQRAEQPEKFLSNSPPPQASQPKE